MRLSIVFVLLTIGSVAPSSISRSLHKLMTSEELSHFFGVDSAADVGDDDYEVVYIHRHGRPKPFDINDILDNDLLADKRNPVDDHAHFAFSAYGKDYNLKLKPNFNLAAPGMKVVKKLEDREEIISENDLTIDCHFLHSEGDVVAALSHCHEDAVRGYVIDAGKPLEVRPLTPRLKSLVHGASKQYFKNISITEHEGFVVGPHIVRHAAPVPDFTQLEDVAPRFNVTQFFEKPTPARQSKLPVLEKRKVPSAGKPSKARKLPDKESSAKAVGRSSSRKTLELALYVDKAAYNLFKPFLNNNDKALRDLVLAFVNGMQALYHLNSLGTKVDLAVVYMEFHAAVPKDLKDFGGERGGLLDSFCAYNKARNVIGLDRPEQWDMGLYLSGLDFFAVENGKPNYVTMGLSTVTGVCTADYNCVIGEFGTVNQQGRPYPSTGFTAVYVMAHEIGHNLGMWHDSTKNNCPAEGFIMSPSRGVVGETQWSSCSASFMRTLDAPCMDDVPTAKLPNYDHNIYGDKPGTMWNANEQCRLLLRDRQAHADDSYALSTSCDSLKCKSPNRDGVYMAGPALDGTPCAQGKWCFAGDCVPVGRDGTVETVEGGWTEWEKTPCVSGCVDKAKGTITSKRYCENPKPINTLKGCEGPHTKVEICDDSSVCKKRVKPNDYATEQCKIYSKYVKAISEASSGVQAPYSAENPRQSCSVYCKRVDNSNWYTPRFDLNDILDVSSYFPNGTWCHKDGSRNYYCVQGVCLAEDEKGFARFVPKEDPLDNFVHNAHPEGKLDTPAIVEKMFQLDRDFSTVSPLTEIVTEKSQNPNHAVSDNDCVDTSGKPIKC